MSDVEGDEPDGDVQDEDTVKILLATDCHLGYEHSTKRLQENDSFITFEEILEHALSEDVDFILLGGDLFHDSKPTQRVVLQCMELLKKYALGDREIKIEFLSNPELIFPHASKKIVNYEDPNLNVALPIFSIHGNHDNPSFESTGSMDLLGASGFVNYFGKWSDLNDVNIPPLVFNKGNTYISLYGLSYMNDQRLSRLLRDDKINLLRPSGIPEPFKIFVLHQNRARHTTNGYIPEDKLPDFLDLIFWGHEHQCRVKPEHIVDATVDPPRSYYITQPGSSVATSLCDGEATEKHVGLLKVNKNRFNIEPIKLQTVRPFVFDNIYLRDADIKSDYTRPLADFVCDYVDEYIETVMIAKATEQLTGHPKQPTLPLIRLRVFYTQDAELFDSMRISRKYCDTVANPRDMILLRKERGDATKKNLFDDDEDDTDINECFRHDDDVDWNVSVQGSIKNYFAGEDKKNQLTVLSVDGLNEALNRYVEAADDDAFQDVIKHQMKKNMEYMKKYDMDDEAEIIEQLKAYRDERIAVEETGDERRDVQKLLNDASRKPRKKATQSRVAKVASVDDSEPSEDEDIEDEEVEQPTRGRGRGSRGRGRAAAKATTTKPKATTSTARGRGRATKTALDVSVSPKKSTKKPNLFSNVWSSTRNKDPPTSSSSQFRMKTPSEKQREQIYVEDSDSD